MRPVAILPRATGRETQALNPSVDWRAVEEAYLGNKPVEITYVDNFLTEQALSVLLDMARGSSIFVDNRQEGGKGRGQGTGVTEKKKCASGDCVVGKFKPGGMQVDMKLFRRRSVDDWTVVTDGSQDGVCFVRKRQDPLTASIPSRTGC